MPGVRKERLEELLRREISDIIHREVKDPRIGFVTVTDAEVTGDLSYAKVFVSVLGTAEEQAATLKGLNSVGIEEVQPLQGNGTSARKPLRKRDE